MQAAVNYVFSLSASWLVGSFPGSSLKVIIAEEPPVSEQKYRYKGISGDPENRL